MAKYKLEDIFDLQMGKTPSRNNLEYWNTCENKWISIGDLSQAGKYIVDTKEYLSDLAVEESGIKMIPANTVVMSFKLSIGKTAITSEDMYSNEAIMAFHDKNVVEIMPEYIYYMFKYKSWDEGTNKAVMGKTLNKATLSKVEIEISPIEKQKEIVEVLDKISAILDKRNEELLKLDDFLKARFVEMFGDPVTNPYSWSIVEFDDCLESIENGKSFVCDSGARVDDRPAILKLSAVTYGIYKPEENKAIINEKDFIGSAEVHADDLLFTRKNTPELVGTAAYVESTPGKLMMPDLIFRLNTKNNCNKIFLWKLINHDSYRSQIKSVANGSAKSMSNISKERLRKLRFPMPPIELQNQFADFVRVIDKSKLPKSTQEGGIAC